MARYNNTSVRNCGYMFLITLMWLTIPVATAYFARADFERYSIEGAQQLADCEFRADLIGRYTGLYARQANSVQQASDEVLLKQWEQELDDLEREYETSRRLLRPETPTHYPRTDGDLSQLEDELSDQLEQISLAAARHDQYLRSEDGLLSMSQAVSEVESAAQYYKRIGAEGIYLLLMEDLAKLEDRFRQLQRHRQQLSKEASNALRDADKTNREIQRVLKHLPEQMDKDEQTTYTESLLLRFQQFNPWAELQASLQAGMPAP